MFVVRSCLAQHFFDLRLRDLLADFRRERVVAVDELERLMETPQFMPLQARAEDDVLGVGHRQRGLPSDRFRQSDARQQ